MDLLDPSQRPTILSPATGVDVGDGVVVGIGVAVGMGVGVGTFPLLVMQPLTVKKSIIKIVDTIEDNSLYFKKITIPF